MNTQMNLQRISVDRLKPAKYNPRKDLKPGDPAYEKIKRSLHEFGYVDPVIWNEVTGRAGRAQARPNFRRVQKDAGDAFSLWEGVLRKMRRAL